MKYGVLNLLTFLIVLLLVFENFEVWMHPIKAVTEKEGSRKSGAKIEDPPVSGTQDEAASIQSYISIAEKNIFSPERKDFSAQASSQVKNPISRPQVILYGVMVADDHQFASIVNPGRPLHKGERETKSLKVGERIGEYKLARILPDRILMEGKEDSLEVLLYDPKAPKNRTEVKTEIKPAATSGTQPAVAPPTLRTPALASPSASAEAARPTVPVKKNLAVPLPTTKSATRSSTSRSLGRGRRTPSWPSETLSDPSYTED